MASIGFKCLASGATKPIFDYSQLVLYSNRFCPYAQRVRLVLTAKEIPHQTVNVNLQRKPDWFLSMNRAGKVPVLERNGEILTESLIICDYLDEVYEQKRLHSSDPLQKAKDRILVESLSYCYAKPLSNLLFGKGGVEALNTLSEGLKFFEREIHARSSEYFSGAEPKMVDFMIWPFFEALKVLHELLPGINADEKEYPHLYRWIGKMIDSPVVKENFLPTEYHFEFVKSMLDGNPNYDIGLD